MMLSKKALRRWCSIRAATACALMVLAGLLAVASTGTAAGKPTTVAEIALYQGPDREQILIEGAKKEGQLTFYCSHTWMAKTVAKEFEKKYPFIKVSVWRSGSKKVLKRVMEEYTARRFLVDLISTSPPAIAMIQNQGILQEYYTPEAAYYADSVKSKGKKGLYYLGAQELYISLGFNTKLIPPAEAPKSLKDLLDPKWKGKMSIAGTSTGIRWIGNALDAMGHDFLEKLTRQDLTVQNISGAALAGLVVSGEVPLSPTIYDSNIFVAKGKGAPVEWRPLEPVVTIDHYSAITTEASHPHAALLLIDYIHSKEGQKVVLKGGLSSPREDIGSLEQKFKKTYLIDRYKPLEKYEKKFNEWESLMKRLFIQKR